MTLDQLRIFVVVAELEHVTRASYALDMVQSAVSKTIATLEGEVDFRLFDRVGRNIRLTVVGAIFRDRAVDLLAHADRFSAWTLEMGRASHDALSRSRSAKMLGLDLERSRSKNDRIELERWAFVACRTTERGK